MGLASIGAIVVIATSDDRVTRRLESANQGERTVSNSIFPAAPASVEIAGRSIVERTLERLIKAGVENISVLVEAGIPRAIPVLRATFCGVEVQVVPDTGSAIAQTLSDFSRRGIQYSFISRADTYVETDLLDLFYFHREARQAITGTFDGEGPIGLCVVDCERGQSLLFEGTPKWPKRASGSYFVSEYVKRLTTSRELCEFAEDLLQGRCEDRPCGQQVRPGVWIDEGAEIHRGARVVGPAYIGRRTQVMEDAFIARYSCIERDCFVDCGTLIEKSCILANTHVGAWLDICQAIVNRNKMLSLKRDVRIEAALRARLSSETFCELPAVSPQSMRFTWSRESGAEWKNLATGGV